MTTRSQALLAEIDNFLKLTGMKPTNFGKKAINDPALMIKLRRGRRLYEETEARVRRYMAVYAEAKAMAA